ncbi:Metallo-dependent hydrolase [Xylariaceae sp. FL0255]|nr:Metallo-dependent hydrolase [Xylariaceae sp. FL0255]
MCRLHTKGLAEPSSSSNTMVQQEQDGANTTLEPFPWDAGVFDAHCHPTDTMTSIASIPDMKACVLIVMSTRSQDQDLVYEVASSHGVQNIEALSSSSDRLTAENRIIPSFGWHPWFSYQLVDDTGPNSTYDGTSAGKIAHYDKILAPSPSSRDISFSTGLPDPIPLSKFLTETRARLEAHPLALVGEIGVDKAFRLPMAWTSAHEAQRDDELTPGGREGRLLSPHRVRVEHQAAVLQAQLKLAGQMGRPVSVHGVQAHGILYETIAGSWKGHEKEVLSRRQQRQIAPGAEDFSSDSSDDEDSPPTTDPRIRKAMASSTKPAAGPREFPPRICLHSYSGQVNQLKMYIHPSVPAKVYFSFSTAVNWGNGEEKTEEAVRATPDDRILVESDLHIAGEQMDQSLEDVCRKICQIKGWDLREGVERLARNWRAFVVGDE